LVGVSNAMEGTVYSVYRYRNMYPIAIAAVSSGVEAIEYSTNHKDEVIKSVIKF